MPSLDSSKIQSFLKELSEANREQKEAYPGPAMGRQPVHTVYGGAQLFRAGTPKKIGETALKSLEMYAPNAGALAQALDYSQESEADRKRMETVYSRVVEKLKTEAVEDFRIDFEDGYGNRPDEEEDQQAEIAARETAKGMAEGTLSPFIGIRVKPFNEERAERGIRTLDLYLSTLLQETDGKLPENFVVTLPKITAKEQSEVCADVLKEIEKKFGLASKTLKMEIMVETTQSILDEKGRCPLRKYVDEADGRCVAAHFGTYDYTAGCDITAAYQTMDNSVCDFAKHMMKVSLAGTPIHLSDGATNVMPVGPHRAEKGKSLTSAQQNENTEVVHAAWRLSYSHIRHSLAAGFYQGWDLHPAQVPIRYAAIYLFFLESFEQSSARLKGFIEMAAKATLLGDVFDDAATGQGLLNYFLRGLSCGAITEEEARRTGLSLEEIRGRSFLKILESRKMV